MNGLQGLLFHEADRTRRSNILAEIWETEKRGIIIRDSDPIPFGADSQPVPLSQLQSTLRPDELVLEYALDGPYFDSACHRSAFDHDIPIAITT